MTSISTLSSPIKNNNNINKVVTKLFDKDNNSLDTYKRFLLSSSKSNELIKQQFPLRISGSSRYSKEIEVNRDKIYNSSLKNIFLFYSRLQQLDIGDFDEKAVMNETISKMELTAFCRDFRLIPKLLSVKDINVVWQGMEAEWYVINKSHTFNSLGYNEFMDCLVRLAIYSYSKPGLQRLILNINGFKPSAAEKVEYFAKYLHLDDQHWVGKQIETVGKETKRNLYSRSSGEANEAIKRNLANDQQANKLNAAFDNKGEASVLGNQSSVLPRFDLSINEEDGPIKEATSQGSKLLPRVLFQVLYPNDSLEEASLRSTNNSLKNTLLRRGSVFMKSMNTLHSIRSTKNGGKIGHHGQANVKNTHKTGFDQINENYSQPKEAETQRGLKEQRDLVINPEIVMHERLEEYNASLAHLLGRYGYFKPASERSDTVYSEGPFLDMGYLPVGTNCVARFQITNTCANDLRIDVMAKGFDSKNTRVTTLPGTLVPGLCRGVSVSFSIEPGPDKDHLAFVEVICAGKGIINKIECPVFYRVRRVHPIVPGAVCTVRNLPSLLKKHTNIAAEVTLNFVAKRDSWQRPNYIDPPSPRSFAESQQIKTLKGAGILRLNDGNQNAENTKNIRPSSAPNIRPSTAPNKRHVTTEQSKNQTINKPIRSRPQSAAAIRSIKKFN